MWFGGAGGRGVGYVGVGWVVVGVRVGWGGVW